MLEDTLILYKLILLYMLKRASIPLTTAQIGSFLLEKEYIDFLTMQQVISELLEAGLITSRTIRHRTQLHLTDEGRETLQFFGSRISDAIKEDVNRFLKDNEIALRNELSILGDYYKSTTGEYEARLVAKERDINLVDITLSVPTAELAAAVCDNWQKRNQEVYQALTKLLFS